MKRVALFFVVMLSGLLLTSCKTSPPGPISIPLATPPIISETPQYPQDLRGAQLYRIVSGKSWVHILVYRGGKLANLGHNHVISSQSINGYIWRHQQPALCGFDIAVPVDDLVVDNNDARAAEGAAFPLNVPDSARQGTMHNMLSAALLDSQRYPTIRLQSANVSQHDGALNVVVNIAIKDQIHLYSMPVTVEGDEHELHVHGQFSMKQTDFGIKPFSIAMGALQVQDELQIRFDLLADAVQ